MGNNPILTHHAAVVIVVTFVWDTGMVKTKTKLQETSKTILDRNSKGKYVGEQHILTCDL